MAKKENRFEILQEQGNALTSMNCVVLLDTVTGVQYLYVKSGYGGGLCPLVNKDGGPITWDT